MNYNTECDTSKMAETANDISSIIVDIKTNINKLYKMIDEMSSDAWVGQNARNYSKTALLDKQEYLDYIEGINELVKELKKLTENIESSIKYCEKLSNSI